MAFNLSRLLCPCKIRHVIFKRERKTTKELEQYQTIPRNRTNKIGSIDILVDFMRTKRGNRFRLVIKDIVTKLTRTVPLKHITDPAVALDCVHNWMFNN